MPSTVTDAARITALEQQVHDLAGFVGRLACGVFGADFDKYDQGDDQLLIWHEELCDEGLVGWWDYKGPEYKALVDELDAKYAREASVDA